MTSKSFKITVICISVLLNASQLIAAKNAQNTIDIINKANNYWQSNNPTNVRAFWDNAAYHTGNMAAYHLTKNESFRAYSEAWANHNLWMGAKGSDKAKWKYSYGESNDYVMFGDWQICFQVYLDLYALSPDEKKIARAMEVMDYQIKTANVDYWWWVDGLYMVMPVMTKMYKLTANEMYLQKLYEYYNFAEKLMLDPETGLFYRDAKYIYPKHKSVNGLKDFWSRGNGWLFAGLARIINDLPSNYKHREHFIQQYKKMASTLQATQQKEGYWTRSLIDPKHAPGPETSGTAFFTYGYLWGINNGILVEKSYKKTALKGWKFLTKTAMQPDGRIGYIQPIGEKAIPGQIVNANSTANFGVGAFLLAATEMHQFQTK